MSLDTPPDLMKRLAGALASPEEHAIDTLSDLASETQTAAARPEAEAADAREAALDPALPYSEAQALRQAAEASAHDAARLRTAHDRLEAALGPRIRQSSIYSKRSSCFACRSSNARSLASKASNSWTWYVVAACTP